MLVLAVASLLAFGLALVFLRVSVSRASSWPQGVPYLGGGSQDSHAWQRFHARSYPMLLLFIAFEMEMVFMYPWAVVFVQEGAKARVEMGMFLAILSVGILYGWREGVFRGQ